MGATFRIAEGVDLFEGGGEMGRLMRAHDWPATPLGPVADWPQSLKVALRIVLGSRYPMFVWWGRQMIMFHNDAYAPILGKRHPDALGKSAPSVWSDIWEVIRPLVEPVLEEGRACWQEERLLVMERNGYTEEAYFTFSYSPVPDDQGGVGGIFCACSEDTQRVLGRRRVRTLRELAEKTAESRTAEDACKAASEVLSGNRHDLPFALIYLLNEDGTTARLAGATGLPPGSPARPATIALHGGGGGPPVWPLASVRASGQPETARVPDDVGPLVEPVWPEPLRSALVLPIRQSGQDGPAGFLVAGISPRRAFDDDYRGFLEMAAGHVATGIANARAYQEERRRAEALAELDRAKTAFFSNVSHEFRTPLTLLLGPVEDVLAESDGSLAPAQRERLDVAHRNALRLQKLVNTLLDFSRIEAGRVQASYEPTDLAALTADLASNFRSACDRAGLGLAVDCPPLPEPAYVDRGMWEKVVLNLLSNAFKYTLEGRIEVSVRHAGGRAVLAVRDTGTGIPAEQVPLLFERFHRVEGARGRTQEGTGIGLALVKELAHLHGGDVRAESALGSGSTFTVAVPLGKAHLPADRIGATGAHSSTALGAAPFIEEALRWLPSADGDEGGRVKEEETAGTASPVPLQTSPFPRGRPRVLLADDNADMRDYVRRLLAGRYAVTAVADGRAALESARENPPDLILSDVMMPRLDGFGLLQAVRANPRTATVPFLLVSARAGEEARVEGLRAGADDYLTKPFSAKELLARVGAQIGMAEVRRQAEEERRRGDRRVRSILESITDAFFALGRDWRFTYVNREAERLLGRTRDDLVGKTIWEEFAAAVGTEFDTNYRRAMDQNVTVTFEAFYPPHDRWYEVHAYPSADGLAVYFRDANQRRQAERALRESEAKYRALAEAMPFVVWQTDAQGGSEYANAYCFEYCGLTPDSFRDGGWLPTVHPDDAPALLERWQQSLRTGERLEVDYRMRRADGAYRWFHSLGSPIRDADGRIVRWVGAAIDVHDKQTAEERLRESEGRFRAVVESDMVGIGFWRADGTVTDANDTFLAMLGYSREDLSAGPLRILDITPPEYRPVDERAMAELAATGSCTPFEKEYIRKDGGRVPVLIGGASLPHDRTRGPFFALDVSGRRRAEEALREASATLRSFYETAPVMMGVVEVAGGDIVHLTDNAATGRFFGMDPAALAGRRASETGVSAATLREWVERYRESERTGQPVRFEYPHETPSGTRWLSAIVYCMERLPAGRLRCSYVAEDVTGRKRAEEALREADRRKDEFLATLAHELRNPLAPIRNAVQILKMPRLDPATLQRSRELMERQVHHLVRLVDDLLDVSRVMRGKVELRKERVDLASVVARALETAAPLIDAQGHVLDVRLPDEPLPLEADPVRLAQVVGNLLANAAKYTEAGGHIWLSARREGGEAVLQVRDDGIGIAPEMLPKVFDLFVQARHPAARAQGGLGIGLTLVKNLVEMHGGRVEAHSPGPGQGSAFVVRLPLAARARGGADDRPAAADGDAARSSGRRLLVVDDNADAADSLALLLRLQGHDVRVANDGPAALELAGDFRPELVFLDLGMPDMDGFEVARRLRQSPGLNGVRLAALTGWGQPEDRRRTAEAGFDHHLVKPVEPQALEDLLNSLGHADR